MKRILRVFVICLFTMVYSAIAGQNTVKGIVKDAVTGEPLFGASVYIPASGEGTVTDFDGAFELQTEEAFPIVLEFSYTGYSQQVIEIENANQAIEVRLEESAIMIETVEVKGQRISEKQKAAPLTVESLDLQSIKQTPSDNFYDGLGSLKGVDLTAASLGFKIVNTRGFNSTSPVRTLQIIDGVDNQAPGLNFSLGNFLGSPELDVLRVDLIQGASSAFYGPNAFNGVISMETKNPFIHKGFSASVKAAERNLVDAAVRWADAPSPWFAYKFNFSYFRADDWEANNYEPVDGSRVEEGNPGRWDAVNIYGDEFFSLNDFSDSINLIPDNNNQGLGIFYRTGYREVDLVDYDTRNLKANVAFHFRTQPNKEFESPEVIVAANFGTGTTVYQGDNRFSLRDILFGQGRVEFRKKDKFFIRVYGTVEDAGNSYDPYFTALRLQEYSKSNEKWAQDYRDYWSKNISRLIKTTPVHIPNAEGGTDTLFYPKATVNSMGQLVFDYNAAQRWLTAAYDSLVIWHQETEADANLKDPVDSNTEDFLVPGTERFREVFDSITSLKNTEGGTRFFDKSALYHAHGEYTYTSDFLDRWVIGGNARLYRPYSDGTVFKDTSGTRIENFEFGFYTGIEKKFTREWIVSATFRTDKNENFDWLFTPAASVVWTPDIYNYLRVSFSSAIRNPTLTDQYLNLNVGRATLLGNLEGYDSLLTVESFIDYLSTNFNRNTLVYFNVDPVEPEKVKTFELGYRTTLFEKLYIDAGYYYSFYDDFIGYNLGIDTDFSIFGFPENTDVYRIAANSRNQVTTQGFAIGANFYFKKYFQISGNYSWNKLNKVVLQEDEITGFNSFLKWIGLLKPAEVADDPIIPAFNTPEHKYNISFSGRDVPIDLGFVRIRDIGFNINYKWIQGFQFEGSPQFTGFIPDYALLDAQLNWTYPRINTTFKLGASNILDNRAFQTYGGPRIGRLAYFSVLYQWEKK